jgi:hypothetical protein
MRSAEIFGRYEICTERDLSLWANGGVAEKRGSITALKALGILRKKHFPFFSECIGHADLAMKKLRSLSKGWALRTM